MTEPDAVATAQEVRAGRRSAVATVTSALEAIERDDAAINSFITVLRDRALSDARRVDAIVAAGRDPGPLAGVPFAVKSLFDVAGEITLAGSTINAADAPASRDADAVAALVAAGAVLTGTLNMDEYAYGFTTENTHYGACHNPHDHTRMAGGSSGGSAAAVAAGLVPIALGSDTNGSVRVPGALCGVYGLKPTFDRLSRRGMYPFCESLDHVGVLGRTVRDVARCLRALDASDVPADPCDTLPTLSDLRIAVVGGHFATGGSRAALAAVEAVAEALDVRRHVELGQAGLARHAAMIITAYEGAQVHLQRLRSRACEFDPMTRDRFLAGALLPLDAYRDAQRFRERFRQDVTELLATVDVLLAPATPFSAPRIGQRFERLDGGLVPTQSYLGVYTQPLSFVGLPVLAAPVVTDGLPLGVQLVAAPHNEAALLRVAAALEASGVVGVRPLAACPGGA